MTYWLIWADGSLSAFQLVPFLCLSLSFFLSPCVPQLWYGGCNALCDVQHNKLNHFNEQQGEGRLWLHFTQVIFIHIYEEASRNPHMMQCAQLISKTLIFEVESFSCRIRWFAWMVKYDFKFIIKWASSVVMWLRKKNSTMFNDTILWLCVLVFEWNWFKIYFWLKKVIQN